MSANIRHSCETAEWGTPEDVALLTHKVLGGIDLDPSSCAEANEIIKAHNFYAKQDNGYLLPWYGRALCNPPGGWNDLEGREVHKRAKKNGQTIEACTVTGSCGLPPGHVHQGTDSSAKRWWFKAVTEWQELRVMSMIFVCFDMGLLQTTQMGPPWGFKQGSAKSMIPLSFPICYPGKRLPYRLLGGVGTAHSSPTHPSCLVFLPSDQESVDRFEQEFSSMGEVVVPRNKRI